LEKVIIFGTGDIAQIARYYFKIDSDYDVVAFTVNEAYLKEKTFEGLSVHPFENIEKQFPPATFKMFIALSYSNLNTVREQKYNEAKAKGYQLVSYISSKCTYLSQYQPGDNCFVFEDNTIQPFVRIGNNVTLWSGNHIGHHSVLHDHIFISSHVVVSGHCEVRSNTFIGVNAALHNNVIVERKNIIASGAIIAHNTSEGDVWVPEKSKLLATKSTEIKL
jgi:sugar O-acyltransferase (sialic acid O-acetyltransferase NeuD family)